MLFKIGLSGGFLPNSFVSILCIQIKKYNSRSYMPSWPQK